MNPSSMYRLHAMNKNGRYRSPTWPVMNTWQLHSLPKKTGAASFSQALQSALSFRPEIKKNVFVDQYIHKIYVTDLSGTRMAESKEKFTDKEKAVAYATKISAIRE